MCGPMAVIAVAGLAISAYGQYQQGQTAKKTAQYQADQNTYNAKIAENPGADAIFRGGFAGEKLMSDSAALQGRGRAAFAAGNVDLSAGTPIFWETDAAVAGAKDVAMNKYNALQESKGYSNLAWNRNTQASLDVFSGRNAATNATLQSSGSLLSGAGMVYKNYYTPGSNGESGSWS